MNFNKFFTINTFKKNFIFNKYNIFYFDISYDFQAYELFLNNNH